MFSWLYNKLHRHCGVWDHPEKDFIVAACYGWRGKTVKHVTVTRASDRHGFRCNHIDSEFTEAVLGARTYLEALAYCQNNNVPIELGYWE